MTEVSQVLGGQNEEMPATPEIQGIVDELKDAILNKSGKKSFCIYNAKKYWSQIVAGNNYFIKIQIDEGGECVHVRIFQPLPHTGEKCELHGLQKNKALEDRIEYIEPF